VGTFNGFKPGQTGGDKIDYVFVEPGADVVDAAILRDARDGRYPSDHFPVTARVRLR
jgi:endonuclease/exonuclease/phosphatase family metal-dependent hydrolase